MSLCVIPARGGSKRIPRKNIRPFAGRPMIAWSIGTARASGCFDRIVVSTDDPEIAEVARNEGAEVPFVRPPEVSDDYATILDVMRHSIDWLETNGGCPDEVCCLYATAPFARADDIENGRELLANAKFSLPVTSYAFPIQRAVRITPGDRLEMFDPANFTTRSQDLEEAYHDAGQFIWGKRDAWLSESLLFGDKTAALVLPRWRVQDIDTEEDWLRAEMIFGALVARNAP